MDVDALRALIGQGKGPTLDWRPRDVSVSNLAASLVALANAAGGVVLVGLTPRSGRPQGLRDPETAIDRALEGEGELAGDLPQWIEHGHV